jgi:hypothetical protein
MLLLEHVSKFGPWVLSSNGKTAIAGTSMLAAFGCYLFFSPLTYFEPLSKEGFQYRNWISFWDIRCPGCPTTNPVAQPIAAAAKGPITDPKWHLMLGDLRSTFVQQEWGEPRMNATVEGKPILVDGATIHEAFGVHAYSKVVFNLLGSGGTFSARAALPDYSKTTAVSVKFKVLLDGQTAWESPLMQSGHAPVNVEVPLRQSKILTLIVEDGGDSNNFDHALWLEPRITP